MSNVAVDLTQSEIVNLKRFAAWRNDPKVEKCPGTSREFCKGGLRHGHFIGVSGEYAASKHYRVPFDLFIDLNGDDKRPDLYIHGKSVQVKVASHNPPILKFDYLDEFNTDVAILAMPITGTSKIALVGFTTVDNFIVNYYRRDFGKGFRFCMDADALRPMEEL